MVLCILDGWGEGDGSASDAITQAAIPNWRALMQTTPHSLIDASELHVGLPVGQMGNSEVGHMNLGAGRVVMQDLPRIDQAIASGELARNPALGDFIAKLKTSGGACHLMGLLSPGGVHAHQDHMIALADLLARARIPVVIHGFLDGRDTPPSSATSFLKNFLAKAADIAGLRFGTIGGRYFAMDRDTRWERTALAYDALFGKAPCRAQDPLEAVEAAYARNETDEFVKPTLIGGFDGIKDGDGLLMANFRADRARQILTALLDPDFQGFARAKAARFAATLGMVEYSRDLAQWMPCLFPPVEIKESLGAVVAAAGLRQLRIAETEKYAHVTFFFNGGEERPFPGEERILIPSPKVATYDLKPEMSAFELTDRLIAAIESGTFDFIVVNYANTDMVGHSGNLQAAVKAVEAVDRCIGRLRHAVEKTGGTLLITADHGNAEMMQDPVTGGAHTAHTLNRVPFVLVNGPRSVRALADGKLADVAPSVLDLMGLPKPAAMTGCSLLIRQTTDAAARATA